MKSPYKGFLVIGTVLTCLLCNVMYLYHGIAGEGLNRLLSPSALAWENSASVPDVIRDNNADEKPETLDNKEKVNTDSEISGEFEVEKPDGILPEGETKQPEGIQAELPGETQEGALGTDLPKTPVLGENEILSENGVTVYRVYEPVETNSKYYTDAGRVALTTTADYVTVGKDYFADACVFGDSRAVGIGDYAGWEGADFYAHNGFSVYSFTKGKEVNLLGTSEKYTVEEALERKEYGKVYVMLGINDTGYGTTETFAEGYRALIDLILEKQPNAIVYAVANLHISKAAEEAAGPQVFTNININAKNVAIAECADGVRVFYLDYNDLFTDEEGYLESSRTFDGYHLYASAYEEWSAYFESHAVAN